eukprot:m.18004 g.18004  ORF g.18004 m.18004 type:complete len:176 (+) comp7265_c0_seq1:125-652(+)
MSLSFLKAALYVVVPLSVVLLFLLLLPLHGRIRQRINGWINNLFLFPIIAQIPFISVLLLIFGAFFLVRTIDVSQRMESFSRDHANGEPPRISLTEYKLVRSQRDFWISLLLLTIWAVLWRLLSISKKLVSLQEELDTLKGPKLTKTPPTTNVSSTLPTAANSSPAPVASDRKQK